MIILLSFIFDSYEIVIYDLVYEFISKKVHDNLSIRFTVINK